MTAHIDNITVLFRSNYSDMIHISTVTVKPNYTTLENFQKSLNTNAMAVLSLQTNLGDLSLVLTVTELIKGYGNIPFKPSDNQVVPQSLQGCQKKAQQLHKGCFSSR